MDDLSLFLYGVFGSISSSYSSGSVSMELTLVSIEALLDIISAGSSMIILWLEFVSSDSMSVGGETTILSVSTIKVLKPEGVEEVGDSCLIYMNS